MPRFFFNAVGDGSLRDTVGTSVASVDATRRMAVKYLGEMLQERGALVTRPILQVDVTDTAGEVVFSVQAEVKTDQAG